MASSTQSTLFQVLQLANPAVNTDHVPSGGNIRPSDAVPVESWTEWTDFDYSTLTSLFSNELRGPYFGDEPRDPSDEDATLFDEKTLRDLLGICVLPTVNWALFNQPGSPYLSQGSRVRTTSSTEKPNWSVIPASASPTQRYERNLLPGVTKLEKHWRPAMFYSSDETTKEKWRSVVEQIVTHMVIAQSRYGFIISDGGLVALRLRRKPDGENLASNANGIKVYYQDPEYALVPWGDGGPDKLSVRLAWWCLCVLGANGDNSIGFEYPPLSTWKENGGRPI